jgi:S1-C subfamily serine protease
MTFRLFSAAMATGIALLASGCATMFSPAYQSVKVSSATPGASILFHGDTVGKQKPVSKIRLSKYKVYHTFRAVKPGYRPRNYTVALSKPIPTMALAPIDAAISFLPFLSFIRLANEKGSDATGVLAVTGGLWSLSFLNRGIKHQKTHRFDRVNTIPALVPYKKRDPQEKYLLVNNTGVDVSEKNQELVSYTRLSKYYSGARNGKSSRSYGKNSLKVDNTIFTGTLNQSLKTMNFIDTSGTVFPNVDNCLYLNATIKKITFHEVNSPYKDTWYRERTANKMPDHLFAIELAIDWDVLDFYKQKLTTIRTVEKSDLFTIAFGAESGEINKGIYAALRDNMESSIIAMQAKLTKDGLLKNTGSKADSVVPDIEIARPAATARTKDNFKKSSVVIISDEGNSSGAIISEDGYIVTSFRATLNTKTVKVMLGDSTITDATIVRKSGTADVALLKINKTGLTPFVLSEDADPEVGIDVWAVGIVVGTDKDASLSHGIVSGVRKTNNLQMLQTDASINASNSGGALVNDKGHAIGMVSMKLVGRGVEGIGFALSSRDIMAQLHIRYK